VNAFCATTGCSGDLMSAAGTVNDDTANYYFYSAGTEQEILE
jgi:hypothetical protein